MNQSLNVRVGLIFDEKSLAGIERSMRSSGQRLSKIGGDLSLSLSLPLAAFGATAIKSAGDIESLTLALKSQLGTADAAAKELNLLTDAAKNPGLGVEQAVRGSVRLQGVGFAAEEARRVLIQMGNAIAATGGSAQELDAVTKQFAQMTSKGRVLQEDVSVLSENMPGLAQLMQKAFGTSSVEAIRAMGVSGKDFVLRITEAAEALPRVESGIKNGIGNAIDSLKQSAAKVGFAINEAFNVTGVIESVSSAVLTLAQGFSSLDPWVQKAILSFAGILVAIGPVIKGYGALKLAFSQLIGVWSSLVGAGKAVVAFGGQVVSAFNAMTVASRAFILVGVITAVIALGVAFSNYTSELTDAEKAQASLADVQRKGAESIAGQKSEVDTLVNAYKQEGTTLKQKQEILAKLNQISPEYFGAIKAGKGDVEALTSATAKYSTELLRVAQITAAKDRLVEIEKAMLNLNKTAEPSTLQTIANVLLSNGNAAKFASDQVSSYTGNVNEAKKSLESERAALVGLVTQQTLADASTGKLSSKYEQVSESAKKMGKVLAEVRSDVANAAPTAKLIGDDEDQSKIDALIKGIKRLVDEGFSPASAAVQSLKLQLDALTAKPKAIVIDVIRRDGGGGPSPVQSENQQAPSLPDIQPIAAEAMGPNLAETQALADAWQDTYISAATNVSNAVFSIMSANAQARADAEIESLNSSYAAQIKAAEGNAELQAQLQQTLAARIEAVKKKAALKAKRLAIAQAIINTAVAVTKTLSEVGYPLGIPLAIAAGIAGASEIATISAQPLFKGTKDFGGGLALVGERGPELVNMPRHSQVFPTPQTNSMLNNFNGGSNPIFIDGEFRISGADLVAVVEKSQAKNQRFR